MAKNNKMPAIRFSGYTNAWEQRKFKDIAFKRGKISEADLPYVEFEDINSGIGTLNKNILKKVGHKKGILFETGDVLFGKLRPYLQNWLLCQFRGIAVGDFWVLQPQNVSPAFLYYLIQSEAYQSVANISSGTKMPRSSWSLVSETKFSIPKYNEANMIGEFFSSIDKNIILHQRKLEKLKLTKKALLQKLFPQNGSKIPELRFKGFTDAWEQRKLNDFVTIRRGLTYKPSDIAKNGIRVLRSSNIDEDQFIKSNDDVFVNIDAVNIPFAKNGDILITSANGSSRLVGKHTIINDIAENSAVHGGFMLLAESNNPLFTDALLSSNWYKRFINTYVAGGNGAIGNLSKSDLESQSVMVPSEHEQIKIGQWYGSINQLITLHHCKVELLKNIKKGLLQKMFV